MRKKRDKLRNLSEGKMGEVQWVNDLQEMS